jgi:hypothetical protein
MDAKGVHDPAVLRVRPAANPRGFVLTASSRPAQPNWTCVRRLAKSVVCVHALRVNAQGRANRRKKDGRASDRRQRSGEEKDTSYIGDPMERKCTMSPLNFCTRAALLAWSCRANLDRHSPTLLESSPNGIFNRFSAGHFSLSSV